MPQEELNNIQTAKANSPKTFVTAKSMLKGYFVITTSLMGNHHPLYINMKRLRRFEREGGFLYGETGKIRPTVQTISAVRFIQLHTRAWFAKALASTEAQAIKLPLFHKPGEKCR
jgi:hypothetical protein